MNSYLDSVEILEKMTNVAEVKEDFFKAFSVNYIFDNMEKIIQPFQEENRCYREDNDEMERLQRRYERDLNLLTEEELEECKQLYGESIRLAINYFSKLEKTFISTRTKVTRLNLSIYDPTKREIFLYSKYGTKFNLNLAYRFICFLEQYKAERDALLSQKEFFENVNVSVALPFFCNIFDIWLESRGDDLTDETVFENLTTKAQMFSSEYYVPFLDSSHLTGYNFLETSIGDFVQNLIVTTLEEFIYVIAYLFEKEKGKMVFIHLTRKHMEEARFDDFAQIMMENSIRISDKNLPNKITLFLRNKFTDIQKENPLLYKLFENQLKNVNYMKFFTLVSSFFVFFLSYEIWENDEEKFLQYVYLICLNTLTNPLSHN